MTDTPAITRLFETSAVIRAGDYYSQFNSAVFSYDPAARTVELIAATETPVLRAGGFYEVLDCTQAACDTTRVASGNCPLLDSHDATSIDRQLGKVTSASFVARQLLVKVKFSETKAGREAESRVANGDVSGVSVGYSVTTRTVQGEYEGEELRVASKWLLYEVSLVSVPADENAGVRGRERIQVRDAHDANTLSDALAARMLGKPLTGPTRKYKEYRVADYMAARLGLDSRDPVEIMGRAAITTSDIPMILEDAANKALLAAYQAAQPMYRNVALRRSFNDFKPHRVYRTSEFPGLLALSEHGELRDGVLSYDRAELELTTHGRILSLTRRDIIDDDLDSFGKVVSGAVKAAVRVENKMWLALLAQNGGRGPTLGDGKPMFCAEHGNLAAQPDTPTLAALSQARTAMRRQTDLEGNAIDVTPSNVYVPPELEDLAEQTLGGSAPLQVDNSGGLRNRLNILVDNGLPPVPWYLYADPANDNANFVYGFLKDQVGPAVEQRVGWDVDGIRLKVTHDFAIGGIDYRFGHLNPGLAV